MASAIFVAILAALSAIESTSALSVSPRHDGYNPGAAHPSNGVCTDFSITKTVTALNYPFALPKWKNNYDVAGFIEALARKPAKDPKDAFIPLGKPANLTQTHTIFATFCSPKQTKKGKESTVLVATHGLGYDGRYWASTYKPEEYSFVGHALDAGYSVFYYDRVGTGKSSTPSGFVTQESDQQAFLSAVVKDIRGGKWTNKIHAKKIVLVGHSFGSFTSSGLIAAEPDLVEGAVLTGMAYASKTDYASITAGFGPTAFAARIPAHSTHDNGYLAFGDIYAHTETFFHPPYSIPTIEYAQSIAQPLGITELLSLGTVSFPAPTFKGKVLVTSGEFDFVLCGGECKSTYADGNAQKIFSGAKLVQTYLHPNAGHGVNFANNATGFYGVITSFLDKNF